MSAASRLRYVYLACLSRPAAERTLYRTIRRHRPRNLVEIGIGTGVRAERMIAVAQRYAGDTLVCYTGIDLFEDAVGQPGLSLKAAYRALRKTAAKIRVEPGDPGWALSRAANTLAGTDLLVISAGHDAESLARAWFYIPRMLHAGSVVFVESTEENHCSTWRQLMPADVSRRAASHRRRQAA